MNPKAQLLAALLAGAGLSQAVGPALSLVTGANGVRIVKVDLHVRPLPDAGTYLEETAFGIRGARPTGGSLSCAPSTDCVKCVQQAADTCAFATAQ